MAGNLDFYHRLARRKSGLAAFLRTARRCVDGDTGRRTLAWRVKGTPEFARHAHLVAETERIYRNFIHPENPLPAHALPPWPVEPD